MIQRRRAIIRRPEERQCAASIVQRRPGAATRIQVPVVIGVAESTGIYLINAGSQNDWRDRLQEVTVGGRIYVAGRKNDRCQQYTAVVVDAYGDMTGVSKSIGPIGIEDTQL